MSPSLLIRGEAVEQLTTVKHLSLHMAHRYTSVMRRLMQAGLGVLCQLPSVTAWWRAP